MQEVVGSTPISSTTNDLQAPPTRGFGYFGRWEFSLPLVYLPGFGLFSLAGIVVSSDDTSSVDALCIGVLSE